MTNIKKDNTEERILKAARTVFIRKGMDGARMKEIADEAGINKALLHYYFRSKQKLFETIVEKLFQQIFPNILLLTNTNLPIKERLERFIENYIDILLNNPFLPAFVIQEMNRDTNFFVTTFNRLGINPDLIINMFNEEIEAGNIIKMNPREIVLNTLSMCLFPFAARPLMQLLLLKNDSEAYNRLLEERKTTVSNFILNSILIK